MINQYLTAIKTSDLFKNIPQDDILELFTDDCYHISNYTKNSIIHLEGEKCLTFDIILEGQVIIQRIDEHGSILTIVDFRPGDNIGGNLLFSKYPLYPMTVAAKSDTKILHIKKDLILEMCQLNRSFLYEYLSCISDKTAILTNKIKSIALKSVRGSIIDFLKYEYYLQNSYVIKLSVTKKELSERLGIQRTSLSRELNKMRNDGLINYDSKSIKIIDETIIK